MGADKASLVVDGSTLLDRTMAVLNAAGIDRVLVPGSRELPDPADDALGPLAGVASGWRAMRAEAPADPVVVVAVDLPWLAAHVVLSLIEASATRQHGAVAHDGERPQPLIAAYRPCALDAAVDAFDRGERSIRSLFGGWDLAFVSHDQAVLADADRPEDLAGFSVEWRHNDEPRQHRSAE